MIVPSEIKAREAKKPIRLSDLHGTKALLRQHGLHTVCEEARCPNRSECFGRNTATFMILGDTCTRACGFCAVKTGLPANRYIDSTEPDRVAEAAFRLGLKHVVITSVNRDDLPDGGARHFADCLEAVRSRLPQATTEVLTPDFKGDLAALDTVLAALPDVYNHNVETVPRLYKHVRPGARYERSLSLLRRARESGVRYVKSGIMIGLGETEDEVAAICHDFVAAGVNMITLGQYFQPTREQLPVESYASDDRFARFGDLARSTGIEHVYSGRFVRSSYNADKIYQELTESRAASTSDYKSHLL